MISLTELRALAEGDGTAEFDDRDVVYTGGAPWNAVLTLIEAVEAAQAAAERLGELTSPPWILSLTPLIAEVRDNLRAALVPFTEERA